MLDPFGGSGTTGLAAANLNRDATLIELGPKFTAEAHARLVDAVGVIRRSG